MRWLFIGLLSLTATGCFTTAFGSADSPRAGWIYVVGAEGSEPRVWLCPAAGDTECELVEVTEDDE